MAHHILGQSRTQTTLFPEALDDFVTEDNPVRVVDVFVEGLDL
jgi:transposase